MPDTKLARIKPSDLARWDGTIDRAPYFTLGIGLMALKYLIDQAVSNLIFHRAWTFIDYFAPALALTTIPNRADFIFFTTMLLISLPFAWAGSVLTIRRLRATELPLWLVALFYVPVINLIFFKVLIWLPSQTDDSEHDLLSTSAARENLITDTTSTSSKTLAVAPSDSLGSWKKGELSRESGGIVPDLLVRGRSRFARLMLSIIPAKEPWRLFVSAFLPVPFTAAFVFVTSSLLGSYGWSVFIAMPFVLSILAPVIYGLRDQKRYVDCLSVSLISLVMLALVAISFRIEGLVCLIMAAPLIVFIALIGSRIGYLVQRRADFEKEVPKIAGTMMILLPALVGWEALSASSYPVMKVTTRVEVDAAPENVWRRVISFPPLAKPEDLIFKYGIAYPTHAEIEGAGRGAVRRCVFSTGTFVEPITVWDAPRLLKFDVVEQAEPMKELSFYPDLRPPHLNGYMLSRQGQFLISRRDDGKVSLEGTTWYQNKMSPSPYWRLWSDWIIHRIHTRVLSHVRRLAEMDFAIDVKMRKVASIEEQGKKPRRER